MLHEKRTESERWRSYEQPSQIMKKVRKYNTEWKKKHSNGEGKKAEEEKNALNWCTKTIRHKSLQQLNDICTEVVLRTSSGCLYFCSHAHDIIMHRPSNGKKIHVFPCCCYWAPLALSLRFFLPPSCLITFLVLFFLLFFFLRAYTQFHAYDGNIQCISFSSWSTHTQCVLCITALVLGMAASAPNQFRACKCIVHAWSMNIRCAICLPIVSHTLIVHVLFVYSVLSSGCTLKCLQNFYQTINFNFQTQLRIRSFVRFAQCDLLLYFFFPLGCCVSFSSISLEA